MYNHLHRPKTGMKCIRLLHNNAFHTKHVHGLRRRICRRKMFNVTVLQFHIIEKSRTTKCLSEYYEFPGVLRSMFPEID